MQPPNFRWRAALRPALLSALLALATAVTVPRALRAQPPGPGEIRFHKQRVHERFISEGVGVADVDGDGRNDILAGPLWFSAPDWKSHEIEPVKEFFPEKGYSESFCNFTDDLNGDGRPDLIVVGFPAAPLRIYENPGEPGVHWTSWNAVPICSNESPAYVDLDGDGRRELVCGTGEDERVAWFRPGAAGKPWKAHPLSGPHAPGGARFYHGLGVGDLNSDGKNDVLVAHGWYECPAEPAAPNWRFHEFPAEFRGRPSAHMYACDVDGDGDKDIIASSAHNYGVWWYQQSRGEEGLGWKAHTIEEGFQSFSQTHSLELADLNGDGLLDVVTGKRWYAHQGHDPGGKEPAVLYWFELRRQGGAARWIPHLVDTDSGVGTQFTVEDLDGDGLLDIVTANKKGVFFFRHERE